MKEKLGIRKQRDMIKPPRKKSRKNGLCWRHGVLIRHIFWCFVFSFV